MINYIKIKYFKLKAIDGYRSHYYEKGIDYFEQLWKLTPFEYNPFLKHVLCHYHLQDYDAAIKLIDQGLEVFKNDEKLLELKASCYTLIKDFEKSFEVTSQLISIDQENHSYLTMHAFNLDKIGKHEESRELYLKITGPTFSPENSNQLYLNVLDMEFEDNNNIHALNNFGYQRMKSGEYKEAIANFDRAIEINKSYAFPYNNRGFAYLKLGELDKAIQDINYSIKLNPDNSYAYKNRALYYLEVNQKKVALENLNKAKALGFEKNYGDEVNILIKKIEKEL